MEALPSLRGWQCSDRSLFALWQQAELEALPSLRELTQQYQEVFAAVTRLQNQASVLEEDDFMSQPGVGPASGAACGCRLAGAQAQHCGRAPS